VRAPDLVGIGGDVDHEHARADDTVQGRAELSEDALDGGQRGACLLICGATGRGRPSDFDQVSGLDRAAVADAVAPLIASGDSLRQAPARAPAGGAPSGALRRPAL